ncbi:hypothetical protein DJ568_15060 [Mucilaginibacter hurinus]|uniref:N-acetyltransferase domain-containing protein n=1 Tax=Mucilaginibacter hurinus TaxID=2201324 RepID=A0A367GLJ5_9SPHI|nr:hypothetical protein [Mucilaginibacter hurinus]RCH53858.1 hypothetical protein DJ568_15060 [Mucilaginibacter hurinus]
METEVLSHKIVFINNFKDDQSLIDEIYELTAPSYKSSMHLVKKTVLYNRDIYIIRGDEGELLAFFMVNPEKVNGEDTYYLGLSGCHDDHKGKGLVKSLYLQLMHDCRQLEKQQGKKILLWWTTGTPIVYYFFNKYAQGVQPDKQGGYTAEGEQIVRMITAEKYPEDIADKHHPFILRGIATQVNYSDKEVARIAAAGKELNVDVFEKFNINEVNGDRFLMIGYSPDNF